MGQPTKPTQPSIPPGSVNSSNPCNYMDYGVETIKRQARTVLVVVWLWGYSPCLRAWPTGYRPIGCTSALACVVPAPLKSRYVTWGAIQVLYAFAFAIQLNAYHCMLFSSTVRIRVSVKIRFTPGVWLVSGYAHVFILLSVVIVTLPAPFTIGCNCM